MSSAWVTGSSEESESALIKIRLPHPLLTTYSLVKTHREENGQKLLQVRRSLPTSDSLPERGDPPEKLHNDQLFITPLKAPLPGERPPESNNTPWGRVRRTPYAAVTWNSNQTPTVGQIWLIVYLLLTLRPELEIFRLSVQGTGKEKLSEQLIAVSLAASHPAFQDSKQVAKPSSSTPDELIIIRSTFWQGAGSPFGVRPAWAPNPNDEFQRYPLPSLDYTVTTKFPQTRVHARHPRRPQKPTPGSLIYSRYIPHLDEHFSMVALDYTNDKHLQLFHTWQNDPRVAQGWNETGSLEQHREYLRIAHEDSHQLTVLAKFEDTYFAYFEVYWAKEDHLGAFYDAGDFDRGRHSLVGDVCYRGSHRVSAWWSSLMHYIFLDDPRTMFCVGEPKATNSVVLSYDFMHGFALEKFVDLPHKRSAFVRCNRERFFQLGLNEGQGRERAIGGVNIQLTPKL